MTKSRFEMQPDIDVSSPLQAMNDQPNTSHRKTQKVKRKKKKSVWRFSCFAPQQPKDEAYVARLPVSNGTVTRLGQASASNFAGAPGKYSRPVRTDIAYVELNRQDGESFGLIIAGGLDHGEPVSIADLRECGIAKNTQLLGVGDRILAVNGTSTDDLNHDAVVRLLQSAGSTVYLEIEYDLAEGAPPPETATRKKRINVDVKVESDGFGFKLRGGVDEGLDRPLTIAYIRPGSHLHKLGNVRVGDRLLSINDNDVSNFSLSEAITALREAQGSVRLEVEYDVTVQAALQENDPNSVLLVELIKPPGVSLGLTLSGSPDAGDPITISDIRPGGISDRCGALHPLDRLLAINGRNLENSTLPEAVAMMLKVERVITLEIYPMFRGIQSPLPSSDQLISSAQAVSSSDTDDPDHLPEPPEEVLHEGYSGNGLNGNSSPAQAQLWNRYHQHPPGAITTIGLPSSNGFGSTSSTRTPSGSQADSAFGESVASQGSQNSVRPRAQTTNGPGASHPKPRPPVAKRHSSLCVHDRDAISHSVVDRHNLPSHSAMQLCRQETLDIEVTADPFGYGFSISGGGAISGPITVSSIEKDSPADRVGVLQVGDRILRINTTLLSGMNMDDVCKLIRESSGHMKLHIEFDVADGVKPASGIFDVRLYKNTTSLGLTINGGEGDGMWISQVKVAGVAYRSGLVERGDGLQAINSIPVARSTLSEAAGMLRDSTDIVVLTVVKKERLSALEAEDNVELAVELVKHGRSLGITLNGSTLPGEPIYVSDIREDGVVHRTGALQKGDIILSINGQSLNSCNVPQAVRLLEQAGDTVHMKIQRNTGKTGSKAYSSDSDSQLSSLATASFTSPLRQSRDSWPTPRSLGTACSDDDAISSASTPPTNRVQNVLAGSRGNQIGSRAPAAVASSLSQMPAPSTPVNQAKPLQRRPSSAGQDYRRRWTEVPEASITASLPTTSSTPTNVSTVRVPTRQQSSFSVLPRSGSTSTTHTTNSLTRNQRPPSQVQFSDAASSTHSEFSNVHGVGTVSDNSSQSSPQTTAFRFPSSSAAAAHSQLPPPPPSDPTSLLAELEASMLDSSTFTSLLSTKTAESTSTGTVGQHTPSVGGSAASSVTPSSARRSSYRQAVPTSRTSSSGHGASSLATTTDRFSLDGDQVKPVVQAVEMHVVELSRPGLNLSFGFSISDGLTEPGVYIRALMPNGIAMQQSKLKPLDRILQINSTDVRDYDCKRALPVLAEARETLRLIICRCLQPRSMSGLSSPCSFK